MKTTEILATRKALMEKINSLQTELDAAKAEYEQYLQKLSNVDFCIAAIEDNQFPTGQLFDCWSIDTHEEVYSNKNGVTVGAVFNYGYTDITGLTDEEFEEVKSHVCFEEDIENLYGYIDNDY